MDEIVISAANIVTEAELGAARLGGRFARLDLASQLASLAVESLGVNFEANPPDRIGICLAAAAGSLATDLEYWRGRDAVGGPSPTWFAYTLPSAAIGVIAIRHGITGPNLCLVGEDRVLCEARDWLRRGEVEACLCLSCNIVTPELAAMIQAAPAVCACALFLRRGGEGLRKLQENDRDIASVCVALCAQNSVS
jgi:3-oxoacyl-(acyl-carrier-protein) synthase